MKKYTDIIAENRAWAEEVFAKIDTKMSAMTLRSRNKLPDGVDENGIHRDRMETNPTWWCNGFWGGLNCMLYDYTKNEEYLKTAKASEKLLDTGLAMFDKIHHDVGFMWHLASGGLYKLTGNEGSKARNFFAANTLAGRFVKGADFIKAWNTEAAYSWSIIDCLMNLPILYWASEQIGDDRFKRIAMAHADTAIRTHLRPDGSVNHICEHDRETGEFVKSHAGQGIAPDSSWSRGQAWAVYGFVISYIHTGEKRYLDAAKQVANYFITNVCDEWVPRVDFRAPNEPVYYDTTAAGCTACGLLELAKVLPENEGGAYAHAAVKMLRALNDRFADYDPANDAMITHGTVRYPIPGVYNEKQAGVHISIIYGDYFFTEAILKLLGSDYFAW